MPPARRLRLGDCVPARALRLWPLLVLLLPAAASASSVAYPGCDAGEACLPPLETDGFDDELDGLSLLQKSTPAVKLRTARIVDAGHREGSDAEAAAPHASAEGQAPVTRRAPSASVDPRGAAGLGLEGPVTRRAPSASVDPRGAAGPGLEVADPHDSIADHLLVADAGMNLLQDSFVVHHARATDASAAAPAPAASKNVTAGHSGGETAVKQDPVALLEVAESDTKKTLEGISRTQKGSKDAEVAGSFGVAVHGEDYDQRRSDGFLAYALLWTLAAFAVLYLTVNVTRRVVLKAAESDLRQEAREVKYYTGAEMPGLVAARSGDALRSLVRVKGVVIAPGGKSLEAPLSGRACVLYSASVSHREHDGVHPPHLTAFDSGAVDFELELHGPNAVRLAVSGREVTLFEAAGKEAGQYPLAVAPERWRHFALRHLLPQAQAMSEDQVFDFRECALPVGAEVTCLGEIHEGPSGGFQLQPWAAGGYVEAAVLSVTNEKRAQLSGRVMASDDATLFACK